MRILLPDGVIGSRLAMARKTNGWTQREAAGLLGISRGHLAYVEAGIRPASMTLLSAAAHLYGYNLNYFMSPEDACQALSVSFRVKPDDEAREALAWSRRLLLDFVGVKELVERRAGLGW